MSATIFCLHPTALSRLFLSTNVKLRSGETEHHYHLTSSKSMIFQIDTNYSAFELLDMLLFRIRLECLKLTYYSLKSNFSKYRLKTGTLCLLFLFSHIFTDLEIDSNYFGILVWKILKSRDHNEIKPPIGKIFQKCKLVKYYFVMSLK